MATISRKYYESLGRFVHNYAQTEGFMQVILWSYAGTPQKIAQSIFSGVKTDRAVGFIRRIREALNMGEDKVLDDVLAQIIHINSARNQILHYGASPMGNGDDLMSTNAHMAHNERSIKEIRVSAEMLQHMEFDIQVVNAKIMMHLRERGVHSRPESLPEIVRWSQQPWRYKPPALKNSRPQTPGKSPKRPPRPK